MSRAAARRKVTSSPSSRMRPSVGISRPAIIRNVVVLPQPDGPNITKNVPSSIVKSDPATATKSRKALRSFSTRICAMACLFRKMANHDEAGGARQDRQKRIAIEIEREWLHEHEDA